MLLLPLLFLYKAQSDLGTTLVAVGILTVLWLGEVPLRTMLVILAVVAVFAFAAMFLVGYRADRWVFLNPWNDGDGGYGDGYQIIRSYYAFAEGGARGVGLGNSHEKFPYLFSSESDFIFAIIGEELGMVGALFVVALFLVFLWSGMRIVRAAPDNFGAMAAGSCVIAITFQAVLEHGLCHWRLSHHGQAAAVHIVGRLVAHRHVHHGGHRPFGVEGRRRAQRVRPSPRHCARRAEGHVPAASRGARGRGGGRSAATAPGARLAMAPGVGCGHGAGHPSKQSEFHVVGHDARAARGGRAVARR